MSMDSGSRRRTHPDCIARLATVIDEPGVPLPGANVPPALTCTALAVPVPLKTAPVLTMVDEADAVDPFTTSVPSLTTMSFA